MPADPEQVRARYPALSMAVSGERPMRQGLMREYVPVDGTQREDHR